MANEKFGIFEKKFLLSEKKISNIIQLVRSNYCYSKFVLFHPLFHEIWSLSIRYKAILGIYINILVEN